MMPDKDKVYFISKPVLYLIILMFSVSIVLFVHRGVTSRLYTNCQSLLADGYYNIASDQKYYSITMDRDHDGISCEQ